MRNKVQIFKTLNSKSITHDFSRKRIFWLFGQLVVNKGGENGWKRVEELSPLIEADSHSEHQATTLASL